MKTVPSSINPLGSIELKLGRNTEVAHQYETEHLRYHVVWHAAQEGKAVKVYNDKFQDMYY